MEEIPSPRIGFLAKKYFKEERQLRVCEGGTGYYIGTVHPVDGPLSRESVETFASHEAAAEALETGNWTQLYDL